MKKLLRILMPALCLALVLAACGGEPSDQNTAQPDAGAQGAISGEQTGSSDAGAEQNDRYVFLAGAEQFAVSVNQDMSQVLAALGEPLSYFEAESCAFVGLDKTYTYAGFEIVTREEGDADLVNSIWLTDDSVSTPEGIYIGCTVDQVKQAYGAGEETETMLSYSKGDCVLNFILEGGSVISIEYLPA